MGEPLGASYFNLDPLRTRIDTHRRYSEHPDDVEGAVLDLLSPEVTSLLDVGPGTGSFLARVAGPRRAGAQPPLILAAVDTSPAAVDAAAAVPGVRAILGDACALPFPDASVDCVCARHMLYHVDDLALALSEAHRVLVPGGQFVAVVNHRDAWPHLRRLILEVCAAIGSPPPGPTLNDRVNAENLPTAMAAVFNEVQVTRYDNALVFTEPDGLVAYAAVSPALTGVDRDSPLFAAFMHELRARLERRFGDDLTPWREPKGFSVITGRRDGGLLRHLS